MGIVVRLRSLVLTRTPAWRTVSISHCRTYARPRLVQSRPLPLCVAKNQTPKRVTPEPARQPTKQPISQGLAQTATLPAALLQQLATAPAQPTLNCERKQ